MGWLCLGPWLFCKRLRGENCRSQGGHGAVKQRRQQEGGEEGRGGGGGGGLQRNTPACPRDSGRPSLPVNISTPGRLSDKVSFISESVINV